MPPLIDVIRPGIDWPPEAHRDRMDVQEGYALLARNRRAELVQEHNLDLLRYVDSQEDVVPFPSVRIAARTLAAFLFGEEPTYTHTTPAVADYLHTFATETNLTATLGEGAYTQSVEGEVYLRPTWDTDLDATHPIFTAIPGSRVIPRFRHGRLAEAAVVTTWHTKGGSTLSGAGRDYYRLIEFYTPGRIERMLFRGRADGLGQAMALDAYDNTEDLEPVVETGIDHVGLVHVPLWRTDLNSPHGVSLFDGLEGMVLALHRLYSQDQHDAEMARRRVAVSEEFVHKDAAGNPRMDRRLDLFILSEEAAGAVGGERAPVTPIEFTDDTVMGDRVQARFRDFLIACGISPDTIDANEAGGAISGTSRRLAQAMTIQTVGAIGRYWQHALSDALGLVCAIARRHLGAQVPDLGADPVQVSLADGFIDDPVEQADTLQTLDTAEAISTEQKVRTLHPEWDDTQVQEEVERIGASAPAPPRTGLPPGVEDLPGTLRRGTRRDNGQAQPEPAEAE